MISCQCITYNRPELLEEAIESFLRQDYTGEKEIVILNDNPEQELVYDHPEVFIFNVKRRFSSIGEKRNACVSLCRGDVIFPWDDDDISLPWRISLSLKYKADGKYFKNKRAWIWQNGKVTELKHNVYHAMGCWDVDLFREVGGYPFIQSGQDCGIEDRFRKTGHRKVIQIPDEEVFYIYKFGGTGHTHLSACGYGRGYDEKVSHTGVIELHPHWNSDYIGGDFLNE